MSYFWQYHLTLEHNHFILIVYIIYALCFCGSQRLYIIWLFYLVLLYEGYSRKVSRPMNICVFIGSIRQCCMSYTSFLPYKLTIRNFLHTFSKICPRESFAYHSFQQFIKSYRQKWVPCKIEFNMTFHPRFFCGVRVANLFIIFFF